MESIVAKDLGIAVNIEEQDYRLIAESDALDTPDTPYSFMRKQRIDKHARSNAKEKKLIC